MVSLFVSHIRPILDYCSPVWNVGWVGDVKRLESVQRRWTKEISGMERLSYPSRLLQLKLYSVQGRLLRADLVKVWKAFNSELDVGLSEIFERISHAATRGHRYKLSVPRCRTELRRRFFSVRVVSVWNGLPGEVVGAGSLETFKAKLDEAVGDMFYRVMSL